MLHIIIYICYIHDDVMLYKGFILVLFERICINHVWFHHLWIMWQLQTRANETIILSYHVLYITYIHTYNEVDDNTENFFQPGLKNDQKIEVTFHALGKIDQEIKTPIIPIIIKCVLMCCSFSYPQLKLLYFSLQGLVTSAHSRVSTVIATAILDKCKWNFSSFIQFLSLTFNFGVLFFTQGIGLIPGNTSILSQVVLLTESSSETTKWLLHAF